MNNLSFRLVSSANKCFENTVVSALSPLYGATAVKNDRFISIKLSALRESPSVVAGTRAILEAFKAAEAE